jgi:Ca2+/Na+ antiporter
MFHQQTISLTTHILMMLTIFLKNHISKHDIIYMVITLCIFIYFNKMFDTSILIV